MVGAQGVLNPTVGWSHSSVKVPNPLNCSLQVSEFHVCDYLSKAVKDTCAMNKTVLVIQIAIFLMQKRPFGGAIVTSPS